MSLKTISVVLTANAAPLAAQLRLAAMQVRQFGVEAQGAALMTNAASKRAISSLGTLSVAVGAGLAVAFGASVVAAARFDREMRNVATISASTRDNFDEVSQSLIDMSRRLPQSAATLAQGLYDIASSGFDGAESMAVLRASAVAASAGLTTTEVAAKGVTAVLNAYGKSGFEAAEVSDILFQTVNLGVVTFEELASNLGDFVGTAAMLGVPIDQASAALATMTLSGISAAEASTSLNRVFLSLIKPSEEMATHLKAQGYESGVAAVQTLGLQGVMEMLRTTTGGSIEAMAALFPEVRGLRGALALMADEGRIAERVFAGITDETARMGATQRAFNEQAKGFSFQLEMAKNSVAAMGIEIGRMALPALTALAKTIGDTASGFSSMPDGLKAATVGLGGVAAATALVGGGFVALAPRMKDVADLWARLSAQSPTLAAGLRGLGLAGGVAAVALAGLSFYYKVIGDRAREFNDIVEPLTESILAQADGIENATDAAIKAQLVQGGLIGRAAELGISYKTLTDAVKGNADALAQVGFEAGKIQGGLSSAAGGFGSLRTGTVRASDANNTFVASVVNVNRAFAEAKRRAKEQEDQTTLLMEVTGATKKELVELGLATETSGDKIAESAAAIGLTSKQLSLLGIESEEAAKAFSKSVLDMMEATEKAFKKDFDVIAQFSASGWEKMRKDAESGAEAIVNAEERLADARQARSDLQDRLAEKEKLSIADHQALAKAEDKVTEAAEKLAEAHRNGTTSLGTMSDEIAKFYASSTTEAEKFTTGIAKAIQMGLDPAIVTRLLQEGPKQAAPLIAEIMSGHGATLVSMLNEGEASLEKFSATAVEMARLTQLAVSSQSGQMAKDLKTAMRIAQLEAESGGKLTMHGLAMSLNIGYAEVKRIVDDFGIIVPADMTAAGQKAAAAFAEASSPLAPNWEALVREVDATMKDFIGPLPPYMRMRADEIAAMWKLGTDPMPTDTQATMYLLDANLRGVLAALPGFTEQTVTDMGRFWRTGLDPMPGDTQSRAEGTATMLRNALDPLPGDSRNIAFNTVSAWLSELAKGEGGTSEQTAAWARALLSVLNPILEGVGATPVYMDQTEGRTAAGVQMAMGGQVPGHGGGDIVDAKLTPGEFVFSVPAVDAIGPENLERIHQDARRGYVHHFAAGGIVPEPPDLRQYGTMVGYTAGETNAHTYREVAAWVAEQRRKEEARAAAESGGGGGAPYTGGDIGSGWEQITGYLDSKGQDYTVTSTYRAGDPGFHGRGKAVDMVGDMAAIFRTLAAGNPVPGINELFYDPMGYFFDEGGRASGAIGGHDDHVHAATFDRGGWLQPGYTMAYNGTGRPEAVGGAGIDVDRLIRGIGDRLEAAVRGLPQPVIEVAQKRFGQVVADALAAHRGGRL